MWRKGYPFRKKTQAYGNRLLSNFFTTLISAPFALTKGINNFGDVMDIKIVDFKREKKHNICIGVFCLVFSILTFVLSILYEMSLFHCGTLAFHMLICYFIYDVEKNILHNFVFDRYNLRKQILCCLDILKNWFFVSLIIFLFDLFFVLFCLLLDSSIFENLYLFRVDVTLVLLHAPILLIDLLLIGYSRSLLKKSDNLISQNSSYVETKKGVRIVNAKILSEIYTNKENDVSLQFLNACVLKLSNDIDFMNRGFELTLYGKVIKKYLFANYVKNEMELVLSGQDILNKMANDINKELLRYSVLDYK